MLRSWGVLLAPACGCAFWLEHRQRGEFVNAASEQAGVNIKGAILNGVIKRASPLTVTAITITVIVTPRKSKTKVAGCGVNAFSGLRIRQFFVVISLRAFR